MRKKTITDKLRAKWVSSTKTDRNNYLISLRKQKKTCEEIAVELGLSKQRVYQICQRYNNNLPVDK